MIFRFINTEKKFKRPSLIATPPVAKSRLRHAEKIQILRKMSTANVEYNGEYNNATSNNATSNNATSNIATPRSKSQPQFRNSSQSPPMSLPPPSDNRKGFESHVAGHIEMKNNYLAWRVSLYQKSNLELPG